MAMSRLSCVLTGILLTMSFPALAREQAAGVANPATFGTVHAGISQFDHPASGATRSQAARIGHAGGGLRVMRLISPVSSEPIMSLTPWFHTK
jgi:hypothetical protein